MKRIVYILLSIFLIVATISAIMAKIRIDSMDQIKLQYDNEVISSVKRSKDFSIFEKALEETTSDDWARVRGLILGKEVSDVQQLVLEGRLTVEELVLFYAMRIQAYDDYYNAVIQLNPEALEAARALDKRLEMGESLAPLAGVVVLVKDNVAATPMNTSAGAEALKDLTTSRDAFVVKTIREKDGIILGKTNLSEWSNFLTIPSSNGFSSLGGQTKNAYGQFDVGGSSSGSAVSAAMNFSSVTIGSETAGSLINPASQNSIVAIKPTLGVLSRDLVIPISQAQDTLGVMGRWVQDVYRVYTSIILKDPQDQKGEAATIIRRQHIPHTLDGDALQGKRIGLFSDNSKTYDTLVAELRQLGASPIPIEIDKDALEVDMMPVFQYGIVHDVEAFLSNSAVKSPFKTLAAIHQYNQEQAEIRVPYGDVLHVMALEDKTREDEINDLVLYNQQTTALEIDRLMAVYQLDAIASFGNSLSGPYAPAGYPALTVPAGYKETGEPYGLTLIARAYEDIKLFHMAYSYEQGTNHRRVSQITRD